ncbi:hypothetical protein SprV_0100331600 [Sparganum proliferum]
MSRQQETDLDAVDDKAKQPVYAQHTRPGLHNMYQAFSRRARLQFTNETGFNPSALQPFEDTTIMETVQFTEGMVLTELMRLKESKSPTPDEIPSKSLTGLVGDLAKPPSLFHTSFETGYQPLDWKSA